MFKIIMFFSLLISLATISNAQNEKQLRDEFTLTINIDTVQYFEQNMNSTPYVYEKTLQIFPGEEILLEMDVVDKDIKAIKVVKENKNPDRTMEISFEQVLKDDNKTHDYMMLILKNPFNYKMKYKAKMMLLATKKLVSTSVIPIEAGIQSIEMWPDILFSLVLDEWEFE